MKNIKLSCKTAGFSFGEVVEVGDEVGQITLEVAEALVNEGLASVYVNEAAAASDEKFKKQITELTATNEALVADKAELEKQITELTAKLGKKA